MKLTFDICLMLNLLLEWCTFVCARLKAQYAGRSLKVLLNQSSSSCHKGHLARNILHRTIPRACGKWPWNRCVYLLLVVSYAGEVCLLTMRHLVHICVDDIVAVEGRENVIGATLSVFSVVFPSWQEHTSHLISGSFYDSAVWLIKWRTF